MASRPTGAGVHGRAFLPCPFSSCKFTSICVRVQQVVHFKNRMVCDDACPWPREQRLLRRDMFYGPVYSVDVFSSNGLPQCIVKHALNGEYCAHRRDWSSNLPPKMAAAAPIHHGLLLIRNRILLKNSDPVLYDTTT